MTECVKIQNTPEEKQFPFPQQFKRLWKCRKGESLVQVVPLLPYSEKLLGDWTLMSYCCNL